jgi:hypothetical protein
MTTAVVTKDGVSVSNSPSLAIAQFDRIVIFSSTADARRGGAHLTASDIVGTAATALP